MSPIERQRGGKTTSKSKCPMSKQFKCTKLKMLRILLLINHRRRDGGCSPSALNMIRDISSHVDKLVLAFPVSWTPASLLGGRTLLFAA